MVFRDYMQLAIEEAKIASLKGEIPVGAVIVKNDIIIAKKHNMIESLKSTLAHAEILAIAEASQKLQLKFLYGCKIYITLEPCQMCMEAIANARVDSIFFGSFNMNKKSKRRPEIFDCIKKAESDYLLKNFFKEIRI